jgi:hypothetical protein
MPPLVSMPNEEQDVLDLALQHTSLQAGADGDDLVRVNAFVGLLAPGELADQLDNGRHAGGTTDEHDVVDRADVNPSILDGLIERILTTVEQVSGETLEFGAGQAHIKV